MSELSILLVLFLVVFLFCFIEADFFAGGFLAFVVLFLDVALVFFVSALLVVFLTVLFLAGAFAIFFSDLVDFDFFVSAFDLGVVVLLVDLFFGLLVFFEVLLDFANQLPPRIVLPQLTFSHINSLSDQYQIGNALTHPKLLAIGCLRDARVLSSLFVSGCCCSRGN